MVLADASNRARPRRRMGIIAFFIELYRRVSDDRVLAISAGVTFYVLLAIFPAIAAGVSLFGLFENFDKISTDLSSLSRLIPGGAIDIVSEQIRRTTAKGHGALGFAAILGLLFSIWSANAGTKSAFDALNIVHKQPERRGFFALNLTSLLFTLALLIAAVAGAALAVWGASWMKDSFLFWPVLISGGVAFWAALVLIIALFYRFGPSGNDISWRWLTWGSGIAATAWLGFSACFSWYAANFGSYDKTYGSLGAAVGFMTWIWLSTVVVLCGEEINELLDKLGKGEPLPSHPLPRKAPP